MGAGRETAWTRTGRTLWTAALTLAAAATAPASHAAAQPAPTAREVVTRAADLMGGEERLRDVERVVLDMMTQWQRTGFRSVPHRDRPSFEAHFDVRDYTIPAWRNTRDFGTRKITNVVTDSVAVTDLGEGFRPLSTAYVDEREELFTYTPDRMVLALLDAPDLRVVGDTVIGGEPHRRVSGTLNGRYPSTVYFHAGTALPTLLRFHAAHPADYGLVPWGDMEVAVWYSNWRTVGDVSIPTQWDIERVGVPYKRMTVRRADFSPGFEPADSFSVTPGQRSEYWASNAPLPMHEGVEVPEPRIHGGGIVELGGFGLPAGAVQAGDSWLALGAGQAPFNFDQAMEAMARAGVHRVTGVVVGPGLTGNGGVVRAVDLGMSVYASPGAEPFVRVMLENAGREATGLRVASSPMELGSGDQRVILAPVDLPDGPGALMLFHPSRRWLWVPEARTPLDLRLARDAAAALGWTVEAVGHARGLDLGGT